MAVRPAVLVAGMLVAGRYRLSDPIGSGGMGTVWRACDVRARRAVAVKVLTESHPTALLRLVQEQSLRLDHPHLLAVTGWAADDDAAVLVMPVARGGSLAALARRRGALSAPFVAVVLDQLLAALEAVHRAGVVHRDVKPENLLLDATGRGLPHLLLADFGVAVHPHRPRLTGDSGVVGTDGYMPPDQAAGGAPEPWWDVYAAGVVARELLGGRRGSGRGAGWMLGAALGPVVAAMTSPEARLTATQARALLASAVPDAATWPALGMPSVPDVLGPAPRRGVGSRWAWWAWASPHGLEDMATGAYDAPGASYTPVAARARLLPLLVGLALVTSVVTSLVALVVALGVGGGG